MSYIGPENYYRNLEENQRAEQERIAAKKDEWERKQEAARSQVQFLFNVLRKNNFPESKTIEIAKRKIFSPRRTRIPELPHLTLDKVTHGYLLREAKAFPARHVNHDRTVTYTVSDMLLTNEGTAGIPVFSDLRPPIVSSDLITAEPHAFNCGSGTSAIYSDRNSFIGSYFEPLEKHPYPQLLEHAMRIAVQNAGIELEPVAKELSP